MDAMKHWQTFTFKVRYSSMLLYVYTMNVHDNYMPEKCFFRNNKLFKFLSESLDLILQANIPTQFPNSVSVSISRFSRFWFFAHFPGNSHSRFHLEQTLCVNYLVSQSSEAGCLGRFFLTMAHRSVGKLTSVLRGTNFGSLGNPLRFFAKPT